MKMFHFHSSLESFLTLMCLHSKDFYFFNLFLTQFIEFNPSTFFQYSEGKFFSTVESLRIDYFSEGIFFLR